MAYWERNHYTGWLLINLVIRWREDRNNLERITSEILIGMKNQTALTVEGIAKDTGVPLGTAQKIFAGITKYPRASAAQALYAYLSDKTEKIEKESRSGQGTYSGISAGNTGTGMVRETGAAYGPSGGKNRIRPYGFRDRGDVEGDLARQLRKPGEFTVEDYRNLPEDLRCELIDGYFYDMASPATVHQRISMALAAALYNYIHAQGGDCEVFAAPFDVQLDCDDKTMVQPDISVVCSSDRIREWGIFGAPDMVIEILSPSTEKKDRTLKTMKYADAGVREYWLVDPSRGRVVVHRFDLDAPAAFFSFEQEIPVGIYEGRLKIRLGSDYSISPGPAEPDH